MVWIGSGITLAAATGSANNLFSTLNAAALLLRPFTIIRTRLKILFVSDQVAAAETPQGVFAKIVISDQASAAGAASIPGPVTNPDAPFHVYEPLISEFLFGTAVGFQDAPGGSVNDVDSKSMRKVGANEDVATLVELRTALGASVAVEGRTLVKLH